jgi:hypothetical protein
MTGAEVARGATSPTALVILPAAYCQVCASFVVPRGLGQDPLMLQGYGGCLTLVLDWSVRETVALPVLSMS